MEANNFAVPKLDDNNYHTWAELMQCLLVLKDLWDAIDMEDLDDARTDARALAMIKIHVKEHILPLLTQYTTARDAWIALKDLNASRSSARIVELLKQLGELRMSGSESVRQYHSRAITLRQQLYDAGHTMDDPILVSYIYAGLPKEYDITVETLQAQRGDVDMDEVLRALCERERRTLSRAAETADLPKAFAATVKIGSSKPVDKPKKSGLSCDHCGKQGHDDDHCFSLLAELKKKQKERQGRKAAAFTSFVL